MAVKCNTQQEVHYDGEQKATLSHLTVAPKRGRARDISAEESNILITSFSQKI